MPQNGKSKKRGRPRKYGIRLGSCAEMAAKFRSCASIHSVLLYGKYRDVNAFSKTVMVKTLKCTVRVVWVFRKTQWVALFSTMAATITWIYGTRLESTPERRHKVKGRNSFAFSDLRHIIAKAASSDDFNAVCNKEQELPRKSFVDALLRMVG